MKFNILVVTKYKWKSRALKHKEIKRILALAGFTDVTFTVEYRDVVAEYGIPTIVDGKIAHDWYEEAISNKAYAEGYNFVIWQFSRADGKKWGVEPRIHGLNFRDGDFFGESWVACDERSVWKFNDGATRSEYPKSVAHEIGHELTRQSITMLEVHDYDYKRDINKLEQFYMDIKKERESATGPLLARLAELTKQLASMLTSYTRPFAEWNKVTQKYGEFDPVTYTMTGHHIGTDFATPIWTEIKAPADCTVTRSGHSYYMGFWCEVKVDSWYMVCLHLQEAPAIRSYKKGETIAVVGKTGMIKGVHAHIEGWYKPMDRTILTRDNWKDLTFDITTKIK